MKRYTVKEVARLAGISVRAMHHYDAVGLLKPAEVGENGYRYYGRAELLRLQQILLHRELEFPLEAIKAVLEAPGFDQAQALRRHRQTLAAKAQRYRRLIRTLDETVASLEGETTMEDKDLYQGFAPEKQAEYEAFLIDRFGEATRDRIDESKRRMKGASKAQFAAAMAQVETLERALGDAATADVPVDDADVQELIREHHAWFSQFWTPNREAYIGLGSLYQEHPDFRARYEAVAPGLTNYLGEAMRVFAEKELT